MRIPKLQTSVTLALLSIAVFISGPSMASDELERSRSEFIQASDAFQGGQYQKALELYTSIQNRGHESPELYFNLGNTYTRLSQIGYAIQAYRQALYRSPRSADLKANLSFVRGKTVDDITPPSPAATASTLAFFHFQLSTTEKWAFLLVLNLIFWITWLGTRHRSNDWFRALRGISCIIGLCVGSSLVVEFVYSPNDIVITTPKTEARAGLDAKSLTRFTLHEGTELRVEEVRNGHARVTLPDTDESGWISLNDGSLVPTR